MEIDKKLVKRELFAAVTHLSACGISHAAKWAAELLDCFEGIDADLLPIANLHLKVDPHDLEKYTLAKTYFDLKEYLRAAHVLEGCHSPTASFLRYYSLFLAGEKRKLEEAQELGDRQPAVNRELVALKQEMGQQYNNRKLDGLSLWLYGVILGHLADQQQTPREELVRDSKRQQNSKTPIAIVNRKDSIEGTQRAILIEAIEAYPYNWSAWIDLTASLKDTEMLQRVDALIPNSFLLKPFWRAYSQLELQQNQHALKIYEELLQIFPQSSYLKSQLAVAMYNLQDFDGAAEIFEALLRADPHRMTNMDIYSNILYVSGDAPKLSYLAHRASMTDKYTVETCCIVGNYYSLKAEHEKAITYFERALKLNPRYISAWTLMGHEFVELKNTAAAIAAYRKAVDISARDYRAWYGLGQTYELLQMPLYALYYYSRACALRPYDARMWCAMGGCYSLLGETQRNNAILCYKRAEYNVDKEGIALSKLAKLYESAHQMEQAAYYYKKNLDRRDCEGLEGQDSIDAMLFLAKHCKRIGKVQDAMHYCTRLLDYSGSEQEEAKALLKEIHATKGLVAINAGGPLTSTPGASPMAMRMDSGVFEDDEDNILLDQTGDSVGALLATPTRPAGAQHPATSPGDASMSMEME